MPGKRNSDQVLYGGSNPGTQYAYMHGPHENFGVFNGQFEQGPSGADESDPPEGWSYIPIDAGGTFLRTTGGYAGKWCACGGQAGKGRGVDLVAQKFIPVSTAYVYYYQLAACHTNNGMIRPGLLCYDAAKAPLVTLYPVAAFVPASVYTTWTLYYYIVGASGTPLTANTKYVRPILRLQTNAELTAAYVYVDDVKFQQVQKWLWGSLPQ